MSEQLEFRFVDKFPPEFVRDGGLCHRCEWRALNRETGSQPRMECGGTTSKYSCYMYRPVQPCCMEADRNDNRPIFGPAMVAARMHRVGLAELQLTLHQDKRGRLALYWASPEETKTKKRKGRKS
jgi:hypothetical protein